MQGSRRSSRARALFQPHTTRAGAGGEGKQFNRTEVGATKKGRRGKRKLKRICARAHTCICRKLTAVTKIFASVYKLHVLHFSLFPLQRGDLPERPVLFNGHHSVRRMSLSNVYVIFIHFVLSLSLCRSGTARNGTCLSSTECQDSGGMVQGNCAAGYMMSKLFLYLHKFSVGSGDFFFPAAEGRQIGLLVIPVVAVVGGRENF